MPIVRTPAATSQLRRALNIDLKTRPLARHRRASGMAMRKEMRWRTIAIPPCKRTACPQQGRDAAPGQHERQGSVTALHPTQCPKRRRVKGKRPQGAAKPKRKVPTKMAAFLHAENYIQPRRPRLQKLPHNSHDPGCKAGPVIQPDFATTTKCWTASSPCKPRQLPVSQACRSSPRTTARASATLRRRPAKAKKLTAAC